MSRSRKRREFKPADDRNLPDDRFRFPMDLGSDFINEPPKPARDDASGSDEFMKQPERREPRPSTRLPGKDNSGFILKKAREIPSAIHGLKKRDTEVPASPRGNKAAEETYEDDINYDAIQSNIVREIVRERNRKKARDERRKRESAEKRAKKAEDTYNLKPAKKPLGKKKDTLLDEKIPIRTMGTEVKIKERSTEKRFGPTQSLPSMNMLGKAQAPDYAEEDKELSEAIVHAFETAGIPADVHRYISNGVIGTHEIQLSRSFRINNIPKLKAHILPHLPVDHMRIVAPIIGTSHIGIETPVREPKPAYFSTLFQKSSLKLRKNDYKFTLGKIADDQIFSFELLKAGHLLVHGGEDSEAEHLIDNMIMSLLMNHTPHDLKFVFALSGEGYEDYKGLPHLFSDFQSLKSEDCLNDVMQELSSRQNQFRRAHVRNISSFNQRVSHANKKSVILVVIDDFSDLVQSTNTAAMNIIIQILKVGKPLGIHLVIRHGSLSAKIRYELLQMMQTRISYKDDRNQVVSGAENLMTGNDMLVQIPTSNKPLRVNRGEIEQQTKDEILKFIREQQS
ncbi:DNA translocase FtsK [Salinicoccus kekensis]|uniref:S-DNA-T family DNA segregation ATPase FtsK/SpoIIIE n=1 Tax=Salinicoccus kekensis TaxID=714307 RepID=A0A285UBV2_9STAP|nr:DNA translocase FtsK [Salinicoccus kekensis]SOC39289.1 S-DNA-T family DNA segregation ATPase FtsK/SpoIIIE [Salinicoccus kekensis]